MLQKNSSRQASPKLLPLTVSLQSFPLGILLLPIHFAFIFFNFCCYIFSRTLGKEKTYHGMMIRYLAHLDKCIYSKADSATRVINERLQLMCMRGSAAFLLFGVCVGAVIVSFVDEHLLYFQYHCGVARNRLCFQSTILSQIFKLGKAVITF